MRNTLFLVADCANLTQEGKLNVMGVFDVIYAHQFPTRHPTMHLIIRLEAELGERDSRQVKIILRDPDGAELMSISSEVDFSNPKPGRFPEVSLIIAFQNVEFKQPGPHQFIVMVDKDYKGQATLELVQLPQPNAGQAPKAP